MVSAVGAIVFFWRAFTAKNPIVDLSAFKDRNFATGSLFSFVLGIGLYGLTYVYPVFLAGARGYSSLQIGETLFISGLCMFVTAPIVGRLSTVVDPRVLIAIGFASFAAGTYVASGITADWDFDNLLIPQVLRGFGLMMAMVPISNVALGTLPPQRLKNASGLYNLTRNLGGAVGLALINTIIDKREDLHLARLHETVSWGHNAAEETLANLTAAMAKFGSDASLAATKQLAAIVRRQALVMSIADVFYVLTIVFLRSRADRALDASACAARGWRGWRPLIFSFLGSFAPRPTSEEVRDRGAPPAADPASRAGRSRPARLYLPMPSHIQFCDCITAN